MDLFDYKPMLFQRHGRKFESRHRRARGGRHQRSEKSSSPPSNFADTGIGPMGQQPDAASGRMRRSTGVLHVDGFQNQRTRSRQLPDEHGIPPSRISLHGLVGQLRARAVVGTTCPRSSFCPTAAACPTTKRETSAPDSSPRAIRER
jgi:hypothetical protein